MAWAGVDGDSGDASGIVDPFAGTVASSGFPGSDPGMIALSRDSQCLYVGFNGANQIQQLTLPDFRVNRSWNLGGDDEYGPFYAANIQAAPAAPQTTAISLGAFDVSPPIQALAI